MEDGRQSHRDGLVHRTSTCTGVSQGQCLTFPGGLWLRFLYSGEGTGVANGSVNGENDKQVWLSPVVTCPGSVRQTAWTLLK
jgi:hypothetical protein